MEKEWFNMIIVAFASSIEREYNANPKMFELDRSLLYDIQSEGTPHDQEAMKTLRKKKAKTKEFEGRMMEYFVSTTGVIKTNAGVDVKDAKH